MNFILLIINILETIKYLSCSVFCYSDQHYLLKISYKCFLRGKSKLREILRRIIRNLYRFVKDLRVFMTCSRRAKNRFSKMREAKGEN